MFEGVPAFDGVLIRVVAAGPGDDHGHVMLGLGPADGLPVAIIKLCATEGVRHLIGDLERAAVVAAPDRGTI